MTIPAPDTPAPARVRELAAGATLTPVWANEAGGLTFRTDDGRYIKHGPRSLETPIAGEVARLTWAAAYTPVPRVIASGQDAADEWLVTAAIEGDSAVAPRWIANAETAATAVRAVGEGLRALHDALPVDDCPFDWTAPTRIANAAARGIRVPASLQDAPPVDVAVVCHGDACCPNTLLDSTGAWTGHVDLGALGLADRWADIAVASMSTEWNYGPGWEDALIAAYGIDPDRDRIAYYRDLWNAT